MFQSTMVLCCMIDHSPQQRGQAISDRINVLQSATDTLSSGISLFKMECNHGGLLLFRIN